MKFCYIDESGIGEEAVAVMVGVITDATRMRVTKINWQNLLEYLSNIIGRQIQEIHTRDFYSGNSPWRDLDGNQRSAIITAIFNWLQERKHHVVFTAVNKATFLEHFNSEPFYNDIKTLWRFMALHLTLSLQKSFQREKKNKGNTVLVFDNEEKEKVQFTDLVLNPPDWTDSYYNRGKKQEKLDQIIDVPHFVDSKEVGLIQLADFICFFLRKHIELTLGCVKPTYKDEIAKVSAWANQIFGQTIAKSCIYLSKGRCDAAELFCKYAPECVL
ncbi:MAG: DUF3800 domain-containing protein [Thermodesulfobacteriota bacterium]